MWHNEWKGSGGPVHTSQWLLDGMGFSFMCTVNVYNDLALPDVFRWYNLCCIVDRYCQDYFKIGDIVCVQEHNYEKTHKDLL